MWAMIADDYEVNKDVSELLNPKLNSTMVGLVITPPPIAHVFYEYIKSVIFLARIKSACRLR